LRSIAFGILRSLESAVGQGIVSGCVRKKGRKREGERNVGGLIGGDLDSKRRLLKSVNAPYD